MRTSGTKIPALAGTLAALDSCARSARLRRAASALTILATLCAVSVLSAILRRATLNAVLIPAFASALLAAIAVCVFMERCFGRAQDNSQIAWGPGAILTLVGMILMLLVGGLASRSATGGDPSVRPGFGFETDFQPDHYASSVAVAVAATSSGTREFWNDTLCVCCYREQSF
jgi:NADH:ubiquinone oxidoreductase subunit 6 (subunit J)